ncbi:unnamed protein product [Gongylonema pulchrum]|uniref:Pre-mRNA 3'-end-processing endonuclease polyadenylation factor C-term domain-containing protein n=1 Tax=Gongylonema pulchrum TaxID=637853 RepID=A0A3P6Q757_9BILA|nr:unnamed protein product [Gongylonema pulchrum]
MKFFLVLVTFSKGIEGYSKIFALLLTDLANLKVKPNGVECLKKSLSEICGDRAQIRVVDNSIELEVDGKNAKIDLDTMHITCTDQLLHHLISSVCQKMMNTLLPVCSSTAAK